jgi:hypothetical protein
LGKVVIHKPGAGSHEVLRAAWRDLFADDPKVLDLRVIHIAGSALPNVRVIVARVGVGGKLFFRDWWIKSIKTRNCFQIT